MCQDIDRLPSARELDTDIRAFNELINTFLMWQDPAAAQPLVEAYEQRIREIRVQALLLGLHLTE